MRVDLTDKRPVIGGKFEMLSHIAKSVRPGSNAFAVVCPVGAMNAHAGELQALAEGKFCVNAAFQQVLCASPAKAVQIQ
jgi:hypothetical protein